MPSFDTIAGVMLGTALGDALGLPHEGLPPRRIERRLRRRPFGHAMIGRRGLLSDDTEHTCMVARALAHSGGEVEAFRRSLASQLQWWLATLPPGIGLATLRGIVRLLLRIEPTRSGVRSAGNGPAMRSALLGVCASDDDHVVALVRASTRMTHTDPRAEEGALVVARLARSAALGERPYEAIAQVRDPELRRRLDDALAAADASTSLEDFRGAAGYGRGVSGFVVHTVPAAVYCWQRHRPHAEPILETAVRLGGDTDTVAAIAGALIGAELGEARLPTAWIHGIRDWPIDTDHIERLAHALASGTAQPPQPVTSALLRNLGVLAVIAAHVFLRAFGR